MARCLTYLTCFAVAGLGAACRDVAPEQRDVLRLSDGATWFSGHVSTDFTDPTAVFITDPGGIDVSIPAEGGVAISGNDLELIALDYDPATDTLAVGFSTYGVAGDVDGDGLPATTSSWLSSIGGTDEAGFGGSESFVLSIDINQDGFPDVVVGVDALGTDVHGFTAAQALPGLNTSAPTFGAVLTAHTGALFASPTSAAPHLEFTITRFSELADTLGLADDSESFSVSVFIGSADDATIGDDFLPASNAYSEVCFDDDGDGFTTCDGDCDDGDADVSPDAAEVCDGIDNDCDGDIDDGVCAEITCAPPTTCLTIWEANSLGLLEMISDNDWGAGVAITNLSTTHDICIEDDVLYTSDVAQRFFIDPDAIDAGIQIGPGESYSSYYGSWTTPNGLRELYLGEDAWWCVDSSTPYLPLAFYNFTGEGVPGDFLDIIAWGWDTDSDGIDDREDWAGSNSVEVQKVLWAYPRTRTVLTVGKTGLQSDCAVDMTLLVRNSGDVAGTGTVTDTIPDGWSLDAVSVIPDSEVTNGDDTVTVTWTIAVDVRNTSSETQEITYTLVPDDGIDQDYARFEPASIDYSDGSIAQTVDSMPVGLFDLDLDCDGAITCETVEVCVDVDLGTAGEHNVFVFNDYTDGVDVHGRVAAGGGVTMTGFSVSSLDPGGDVLVANTLTLDSGTVHGDAVYTTIASISTSVSYSSGGGPVNNTPIDFPTEQATLEALSAGLCAQPATATTTLNGYGGISLSGSSTDVDVYTLDIADLEAANGITISATGGAAIINVTGTSSTTIGGFAVWLSGLDETDILWNFCDATALDFSALGIEGTTLAPLADVTFDNGNFDGSLIAASLTGAAEGHLYPFDHTFELCTE
jgi:choice-of-anchor A domain-containing protein